jgi:D-alanyl-D-alanine carboxypeptidase (penicillin-binding protein 5/6)
MSARDIATLVRAIIAEFPEYYAYYAIKEFSYNAITQHNRNRLLWQDASVDGVKTGHTRSAGYCLSASAKRGDTRLVSVVLGAENEKNRFSATQSLLNYGFRFFETHKLYEAGKPLAKARIWKGASDELPLGLAEDFFVTIPKGRYEELSAALTINKDIAAPAAKGTSFGTVSVTLDDEPVASAPLVALQDVAEAGIIGRLTDSVMMLFSSYWD